MHDDNRRVCWTEFGWMFGVAGFLAAVWTGSAAFTAEKNPAWKAGVATAVITPDGPMWMAGYAARNKPSEGKIHDLYAKALAVEDDKGTRLVIVGMDLISVPRPMRDWLETQVKQKYNLPPGGIFINCSHTHSGPELRTTPSSLVGLDAERVKIATAYVEQLQAKLLALVGQAIEDLEPARLAYSHARAGFAMNRRLCVDGEFRNRPNPDGPVDHDVPVLRVGRPDGELLAVVFGYACHSTTLGFYQFCGDYGGFAQEYLQAAHPGATAMFLAGCGADQNPYPRRTLELAQQHGRALANAVEVGLTANPRPVRGPLRHAYETVTLDYQDSPTREELLQRKQSKNRYDRIWAERLLQYLDQNGKVRDTYACPVQVVRFGNDLTIVGLAGETVVDYSLRLKRELTASKPGEGPAIWVTGYTNDVFAYLPSVRVLEEGGYEASSAMKYMSTIVQPGPFTATVEERIIAKVHELNRRLTINRDKASGGR